MDSHRFDTLTKYLYILKTRREGLRVLLASIAAGALSLVAATDAAACKGKGNRCGSDRVCCSGRCRIRREGKNRRKPKRAGNCACSEPQQRCNAAADCCDFRQKCLNGQCADCRKNGESCSVALDCCDLPNVACGANGCGAGPVCCAIAGEICTADCDCCAPLVCRTDGTCGAACGVICPPGSFEPCCPAGTTCESFGCVTDEPGACPAGADTCARPLVFCGAPPLSPQECACFQDLAGNPFCSLSASCSRECDSNADCEDERFPGSRCIGPCPDICGHDRGVCSSAACPV